MGHDRTSTIIPRNTRARICPIPDLLQQGSTIPCARPRCDVLSARAGCQCVRPGAALPSVQRHFDDEGASFLTVDPRMLDASMAGRTFDEAFLSALPASADPCGER